MARLYQAAGVSHHITTAWAGGEGGAVQQNASFGIACMLLHAALEFGCNSESPQGPATVPLRVPLADHFSTACLCKTILHLCWLRATPLLLSHVSPPVRRPSVQLARLTHLPTCPSPLRCKNVQVPAGKYAKGMTLRSPPPHRPSYVPPFHSIKHLTHLPTCPSHSGARMFRCLPASTPRE